MTFFRMINPEELGAPKGWNNGVLAPANGRLLFVAGQNARNPDGTVDELDFVAQFAKSLDGLLAVVGKAGGTPEHIARMTVYVTDLPAYLSGRKALGQVWRERLGRHYPAMTLVEVSGLVDEGAVVEIEATAVLPP